MAEKRKGNNPRTASTGINKSDNCNSESKSLSPDSKEYHVSFLSDLPCLAASKHYNHFGYCSLTWVGFHHPSSPFSCGQLSHTVVFHLPGTRRFGKHRTAELLHLDCTDISTKGPLIMHFKEVKDILYLRPLCAEMMDR